MKRILCLWLPNWPIQRLIAVRPELKGQALILSIRQGSRGQRVVACSAEASAMGVCRDMPLTEATSLVRKSSRSTDENRKLTATLLHTEPYDPGADRRKIEELAEWCEKFSPIVGIEPVGKSARGEPEEPESLLLDVTGLGPLFGGEKALLQKMVTEFAQRGYQARAAVADALGTAWGFARFASLNCASQEPPGSISPQAQSDAALTGSTPSAPVPRASDSPPASHVPNIFVVPPGHNATAIASLPLAALRLPAAAVVVLQQLGIQQVDQLFSLPRAGLSSRFGDDVILRMDQALGRVREVIVAHRPQPTFQADWLLEYATAQRELVEFITRQLIERVAHLLAEQNRGAVRLEICLRCVSDEEIVDSAGRQAMASDSAEQPAANHLFPLTRRLPPLVFRVGLFRPTAVTRHLWDLAQLQLEQTPWPGPVEKIAVQASLTAPLEIRQGQLFEEGVRDGQQQLAHLIERLSNRLGSECVLQPRVVADAQPDRACRYVPLTGRLNRHSRKGSAGEEKKRVRFCATDRPLSLQHPPLALQVLTAINQEPPARFRDQHRWHAVVRYWGPERIETGWWRGRSVRRDYYRVETEAGLWFWIFRQLDDGRWFLQGRYE